jgi:hypothetical protein
MAAGPRPSRHGSDFVRPFALLTLVACNLDSTLPASPDSTPVPVPVLTQTAYIKASNTDPDDGFSGTGVSGVALSGDGTTLAVAAPGEASAADGIGGNELDNTGASGAVYVYVREGAGWAKQAFIKASNSDVDDLFGYSIGISADGNTLVVSAIHEASASPTNQSDNTAPMSGAAYVFVRSGGAWSQQAYLKASNLQATDVFGHCVAITADGNRIAVSAPNEDSSSRTKNETLGDSGAVYIFERSDQTWTETAMVKPDAPGGGDQFGWFVVLSGETLAVVARAEDGSGRTIDAAVDEDRQNSGAVYVFDRRSNAWPQSAYIKAPNGDAGDELGNYGASLSGDGSTLAVGTSLEDSGDPADPDDNSQTNSGAIYVYRRSGTSWDFEAYVKSPDTTENDAFGVPVLSGSGDTLVACAHADDSNAIGIGGDETDETATDSGACHVFVRDGQTWTRRDYVKASNAGAFDAFGSMVSIDNTGRMFVVGAPFEDSDAKLTDGDQGNDRAPDSGAAYVFEIR